MKVRLKSFGLMPTFSENMPSGIVPKPPKPGFVSFGAIDVGGYWEILRRDGDEGGRRLDLADEEFVEGQHFSIAAVGSMILWQTAFYTFGTLAARHQSRIFD